MDDAAVLVVIVVVPAHLEWHEMVVMAHAAMDGYFAYHGTKWSPVVANLCRLYWHPV